jgi:hypothetical protein
MRIWQVAHRSIWKPGPHTTLGMRGKGSQRQRDGDHR